MEENVTSSPHVYQPKEVIVDAIKGELPKAGSELTSQMDNFSSLDSRIGNVSIRALLAFILVTTCCILAAFNIEPNKFLEYLTVSAISFFFGHSSGSSSKS